MRGTVRACNVVEGAVSQVLERSGDARRRMILHRGHIDDLRDFVRDNTGHVGTGFPLTEEIRITINIRLIANHTACEPVLDSYDSHFGRQQRLIAANIDLVRVSVIHHDMARGYSNRSDCRDNLPYDLGGRTTSWRTRWIDLDANNVLGFDKFCPGVARGTLSRQFLHRLFEQAMDDGLRNAIPHNRVLVSDLDDSPWEQSWHPQRRRRVVG